MVKLVFIAVVWLSTMPARTEGAPLVRPLRPAWKVPTAVSTRSSNAWRHFLVMVAIAPEIFSTLPLTRNRTGGSVIKEGSLASYANCLVWPRLPDRPGTMQGEAGRSEAMCFI